MIRRLIAGDDEVRSQVEVDENRPASLRGYNHKAVSVANAIETGSESKVQQHFGKDVDINTIVRRFGITKEMPLGAASPGVYGDFTGIYDFESAVERVEQARAAFMRLPAEVRSRFDNDPGKLVQLAQELPEQEFAARMQATQSEAGTDGVVPSETSS